LIELFGLTDYKYTTLLRLIYLINCVGMLDACDIQWSLHFILYSSI
jgi:hypothetical protein